MIHRNEEKEGESRAGAEKHRPPVRSICQLVEELRIDQAVICLFRQKKKKKKNSGQVGSLFALYN